MHTYSELAHLMAVTGGLRKDTHIYRPEALQPFGLVSLIQMRMQAKEYTLAYPELYIPIESVIDTFLLWLGGGGGGGKGKLPTLWATLLLEYKSLNNATG